MEKVNYTLLINIIKTAPGFTPGQYDGILSKDDSVISGFKVRVISFCNEGKGQEEDTVIDGILKTCDYSSVKNVIDNLKNKKFSDLDYQKCNEFAEEFVKEVNDKIKKYESYHKKYESYHKIIIMQCAIIDAIHTINKEAMLSFTDNRIIIGLATGFKHWFKNIKIKDSDFRKNDEDNSITNAVKCFLEEKLNFSSSYDTFALPKLKQILECFEKKYDNNININTNKFDYWINSCVCGDNQIDKNIKKYLRNIAKSILNNNGVDDKLITNSSENLAKIFNTDDIYLIKKELMSSVNAVIQKKEQKSKSSDDAQQANIKPENNDGAVAVDTSNDNKLKKFLESFEKIYSDNNWINTCTDVLDIKDEKNKKTLENQLTNLANAIKQNNWIAASSRIIIYPLSKTLSEVFGLDIGNVKNKMNDAIKELHQQHQQQLLKNFFDAFEKSLDPFYAELWWNNLFDFMPEAMNRLVVPLFSFMQCVTGEISGNIDATVKELSEKLCNFFAVNNTDSVVNRLREIIQLVNEKKKSAKEKYGTKGQEDFALPTQVAENTAQVEQAPSQFNPANTPDTAQQKPALPTPEISGEPKKIANEPKIQPESQQTPNASAPVSISKESAVAEEIQTVEETIELPGEEESWKEISIDLIATESNIKRTLKVKIPNILANHWDNCHKNEKELSGLKTNIRNRKTCTICTEIDTIVQYIRTNDLSFVLGLVKDLKTMFERTNTKELDDWINVLKNGNFKKESGKIKRFAKRAVSKNARDKHKNQKEINISVLLDAINALPSEIKSLTGDNLETIKSILRVYQSSILSNSVDIKLPESHSEKTIEQIAKNIRKSAKQKDDKGKNANSDSIVALGVLYKVLTYAITLTEEQQEEKEKLLFKAFAKWFNKYVSPRSAIRSLKVVGALNSKIGNMAGNANIFKCEKSTRIKDAIKGIAKKASKSNDTDSEAGKPKARKRDKVKKIFSRGKKKQN